ncbi:ATPase family AAA domain-containing protein 5b [Centropristis striata]|uniref:ATPase family AAA domain-containing protein 5b n=1 Tax=Centropristis striata TaxID=184440 RepID=UPI0027DF3BAC|nr:ATPase family AAA domain-containing protein 5b [Centropristis striata]
MRNKLKKSEKCKDTPCPSRELPKTAEVITLESESSCSSDETSPRRGSNHKLCKIGSNSLEAKDTCVVVAGISTRKTLQEQREIFVAKDIKIAPIFLHKTQHSNKSKHSSDGKLQESAAVLPQTEDVQLVKSQQRPSTVSHLTERQRSRRGQLSPSSLHRCLEEIQTSNPAFPVRTVFSTLQEKASKKLQGFGSTAKDVSSLQNLLTEKRKRGSESSEHVPKRLRSSLIAEGTVRMGHCDVSAQGVQESAVMTITIQRRGNKLSRTHRLRQQSVSPAGLMSHSETHCGSINHTESYSESLQTSDILRRETCFEDTLWTDKYSPQHSSEVIGHSVAVNKLQSWLKKWKLRADCDERRKLEEKKHEENSSDSWDCGDFQGEAGGEYGREEPLCNTMLITGPPGVGKTASVYACAQELGFKVFEVNASSQRSGRHVLSQLKEATQSHLVEISGKDLLKPAYFNNYNINSSTLKSETLAGKTMRPRNVTSTSKNRAAQKFGHSSHRGKANPTTVTLANYFRMKAKADDLRSGGPSPSEKPDIEKSGNPSPGSDQTAPQDKKTATSLILFEEVDVIFDDDVGFYAAIKTFMTTTKRPVILTTNDPSFKERFSCSLEEIIFKTPSVTNVCSYLQLVGLAENARLEFNDISNLLRLSSGDVRRCLLQLQLWVHSGGGRAFRSGGSPTHVQHSNVTERGDDVACQLPHCVPDCAASILGLHPLTKNQLLNLLKCQYWSEIEMNKLLRLLTDSWRRGVPLLYSNLELLLPVGTKGTPSGLQREPSDNKHHIQQLKGNASSQVSATARKSVRNLSRLSRRKHKATMFDTTPSSSTPQNPQRTSLLSTKTAHSRVPIFRDKAEEKAAKAATDCLDALADFFDLMSYLDSTMPADAAPLVSGSWQPEAFVWTGAEIKDGLLDETSEDEEVGRIWSKESVLDIQAAAEGLGFHSCCWRVSEVCTEAEKYRQGMGDTRWATLVELPASSKTQSLSFSFPTLCSPSMCKKRYELSRMVLGSKPFSLLGNRRAVSVDYMPILRHICRHQRAQEEKEELIRCLNFLSSSSITHLGLSKSTIQLLAEDFS